MLALIALLLTLRNPAVVATPRLWAEEADLLFANAWFLPGAEALWNNGWLRAAGYLNVFPIVATWLAAKASSLELAPTLVLVQIAAIQGAALALALAGPRRVLASPLERGLAAAVLLLFPYHHGLLETWLSVMSAPVHFGVAALLLLLADEARESRFVRIAGRALLVVGALTGPYTIVLAPLFALKLRWHREPEVLLRALLVGGIALLQGALALAVILGGESAATRELGPVGPARIYIAVVFQALYAIVGELPGHLLLAGFAVQPERGADWGGAALALGIVIALALAAWRVSERGAPRTLLLLAFASWFAFTTVFAVKGIAGYRYAVCPSIALGLLLLHAAASAGAGRPVSRTLFGSLVAAGLASGLAESLIVRGPMTGLGQADWRAEVARWRANPDHRLRAWPSSVWYTNLADPSRRDALDAALARLPAQVELPAGAGSRNLALADAGLPAYFAIRFEACAPDVGGELVLAGASRDAVLFEHAMPLAAGCATLDLNSMTLAISGFQAFSAVTALEARFAGAERGTAILSAFRMTTPVLTVSHPLSGD